MPETPRLAGVELGGTKCLCILGSGPDDVREQVRIPTQDGETTLARIEAVLDGWRGRFDAIGIASFGPVDLDPQSARYGFITSTPKPGWSDCDVAGRIARRFAVPTAFDTDVNGAALAEGRWGAAQGLESFAYVTVGTGIGVGLVTGGRVLKGFGHPELGHIRIAGAGDWPGICPFHGNCVEGLASGPAIAARAGAPVSALDAGHAVWEPVAHALGQLLHAIVCAATPRRILMGGGVMGAQPHLFPGIRRRLVESLAGYIALTEATETYVSPPGLGDMAGPLGALALAQTCCSSRAGTSARSFSDGAFGG